MDRRIGIIASGSEIELTRAIAERCAAQPGIAVEMMRVGGTSERQPQRHDVILDRMSRLVPHYRSFLKAAALAGASIVNDPFAADTMDRFFTFALASRLGMSVPRSVLLPQHSYGVGVDPEADLQNLEYPLRWEAVVDYVKLPALLRPLRGAGGSAVGTLEELWRAFDRAGTTVVMLQEPPPAGRSIHCLCIGHERVLLADEQGQIVDGELGGRAGTLALGLARAVGYDLCAIALCETPQGELVLLDAPDPVPTLAGAALARLAEFLVATAWGRPAKTAARYGWL